MSKVPPTPGLSPSPLLSHFSSSLGRVNMSYLPMSLSISTPPHNLSSSRVLCGPTHLFVSYRFSHLSISKPLKTTTIRMGGGPRTYPGGVSKWQWKRMQAKKAKQLLKARLSRERQIYEMRKRAELKAAVSELERPWEVVEKAPNLFSASADDQVKVLADRFQKPGGFDLWSEKDGPQLFEALDGIPSARFFPKGVVLSIKPYERITDSYSDDELDQRNVYDKNPRKLIGGLPSEGDIKEPFNEGGNGMINNGKFRKNGNRRRIWLAGSGDSNGWDSGRDGFDQQESGRRNGYDKNSRKLIGGFPREGDTTKELFKESGNVKGTKGKFRKNGNRRRIALADLGGSNGWDSGRDGFDLDESRRTHITRFSGGRLSRGNGSQGLKGSNSAVFDMGLQHDGNYGFSNRELENLKSRRPE